MESVTSQIKDFYADDTLMLFTQFKDTFKLPGKHNLKDLQFKSFMSSEVHHGRRCPPLNSSRSFTCRADVKHPSFLKKTLSSLLVWERDLQSRMEGGTSSGPNSNYKYNIQTFYITPVQLHHVNPNIPD